MSLAREGSDLSFVTPNNTLAQYKHKTRYYNVEQKPIKFITCQIL